MTKRRGSAFSGSDMGLGPEVDRTLTERLFPQWVEVTTANDWTESVAR